MLKVLIAQTASIRRSLLRFNDAVLRLKKYPLSLLWGFFIIITLLILSSCTPPLYNDYVNPCQADSDCPSGICNLLKADNGLCLFNPCTTGDRTSTNHFFCNISKEWQSSKQPGESCNEDYECFRQSCFMNPTCDIADIPAISCKNNICTSEIQQNECEQQGLKKILRKDQYNQDCFESVAQMILPTVCTNCGNNICETKLESKCNCPEDCS